MRLGRCETHPAPSPATRSSDVQRRKRRTRRAHLFFFGFSEFRVERRCVGRRAVPVASAFRRTGTPFVQANSSSAESNPI